MCICTATIKDMEIVLCPDFQCLYKCSKMYNKLQKILVVDMLQQLIALMVRGFENGVTHLVYAIQKLSEVV